MHNHAGKIWETYVLSHEDCHMDSIELGRKKKKKFQIFISLFGFPSLVTFQTRLNSQETITQAVHLGTVISKTGSHQEVKSSAKCFMTPAALNYHSWSLYTNWVFIESTIKAELWPIRNLDLVVMSG